MSSTVSLTAPPYAPLPGPASASSPSFSSQDFRAALGRFATGVTIVTARTPTGELVGLTANSFNSVSLTPPLVLWSLSRNATTFAALTHGAHYAIHILSAEQQALALQFAAKGADRWQGVAYSLSPSGHLNALTAAATKRATT
jgi:flavin reductase (DIM6/NTAB) family NADH-FMN oxidoreductase RutF